MGFFEFRFTTEGLELTIYQKFTAATTGKHQQTKTGTCLNVSPGNIYIMVSVFKATHNISDNSKGLFISSLVYLDGKMLKHAANDF